MKNQILCALVAVCATAVPAAAQFTVSQPAAGSTAVKAANDFATTAFQDPWDMSQRTDVGWWTFGTDTAIAGNFQNPSVANGVFSGSVNGAAATLFLLESPLLGAPGFPAAPVGKTGQQFPINSNVYTHLVYRMNSTIAGVSQYAWSHGTIYDDQTLGFEIAQSATVVQTGWKYYDIDLSALPGKASASLPYNGAGTNGTIRALQIIPLAGSPTGTIQLDWARLVQDDASLKKTIAWSGGTADIYLDNDTNSANGTLGRIAVNATSPYTFFVGALPAGTYYVAVHAHTADETPGSAGNFSYSPGNWVVNDIPTLQWTTPSEEGSSDDFATTKLGNTWDFTSMNDIDTTLVGFSGRNDIVNDSITTLNLTNEAGVNLGSQTVYFGTSTPCPGCGAGDPFFFTMFWDGKGKTAQIDPTRYRILTVDAGIPNLARSLPGGSIARVVWRAANESVLDGTGTKTPTVGQAWEFNSAAGENTMAHITIDMKNMPLAEGFNGTASWLSTTATSKGLDAFRFDPHEFSAATNFFVKRIKLAALERTLNGQFTFKWNLNKAATVTIFYDTDPNHTFTLGTQACTASAPAGAGSCTWTVGVGDGEYQIYAKIDDGTNTNFVYAPTNLVVDSTNTGAQISLNRTSLNFATFGATRTAAQGVHLSFSGPGAIGQCWTAAPNLPGFLTISPSSGNGPSSVSITASGNFPVGNTAIAVLFQACNNPRNSVALDVSVNGDFVTNAPTGSFDTPADGSPVAGSVAVTGWAADDVQVTAVEICRDPVGGEGTTPGSCGGQNQVFIGNAIFSDDARPDIQASFPTDPYNYRAGWGYLMLTNFLPNGGNGTYKLWAYALDAEGHTTLLGSKTITGQNQSATKPFGSIDRPLQGETVCGTIVNAGWVLTQSPKDVPADSHTVNVFVDNVNLGNLQPGRLPRADITQLFSPTYDTSHAAGGFFLDTTTLSNGVHTIFWVATDTGNNTDGIGSRFFTVANPCGG